ncbi:MAG TPA: SPFH domain-containing protein [Terracidiphilus sp.]|nr:SPFH domain-containing protein [Terracidiphilus sp.]
MLAFKTLLMLAALAMLLTAIGIPLYQLWLRLELKLRARRAAVSPEEFGAMLPTPEAQPIQWRGPAALALAACVPLLMGKSIVVVPSGMGGVRVSQISGTLPGTLYPGVHFIAPLVDSVQLFDLRDHIYTAGLPYDVAKEKSASTEQAALEVQSREGLNIGLGVTVRYRLDSAKLASVQARLPQPADQQILPPVVASAWRQIAPEYTVREIFSSKREEVRSRAAAIISGKLASDGIVVEEVMLSDIQLPEEYSKGLEGLLLKEQQDDQMSVDTEIQRKQVEIAELEAEAQARQKVQQAKGDAQARVVEAKGEADAMQFTLPLKQKQIEQSKLEAEARKEATIQNAEADAQAKIIDSKAEPQRRDLLAQAEAGRIRLVAAADADRMKSEAALLNQSPLLINKIVAERLSDKIRLVMVPSDGKYFFASDVLKGLDANATANQPMSPHQPDAGNGN